MTDEHIEEIINQYSKRETVEKEAFLANFEDIEKKIKEKYNLNCFVKIDNSNITTVCISSKHDNALANNIMRLIQEQYENKMYISVKFEKK